MHKRSGYVVYVEFDCTVDICAYELDGWLTADERCDSLTTEIRHAHHFRTEREALKGYKRWATRHQGNFADRIARYEVQHQQ